MNINFNDATYEKMRFLSNREGKSVAAWVSQQMDRITSEMVSVEYTIKPSAEMSMDSVITTNISGSVPQDFNPPARWVGNYQLSV